jgi:hypothetical protein
MTFVWTFEGVMQAIGLVFVVLFFLFFGLMLLIENIRNKLKKARKK